MLGCGNVQSDDERFDSKNFELVNSHRGKFRLRTMKTRFERHSLLFIGPAILWNSLNVNKFKFALKKFDLDQISFIKGTCVN